MREAQYEVVTDPAYKYRRLDPLPSSEELEGFYRDKYYELVAAGGRAPELNRILRSGREMEDELAWLAQTLWSDIKDTLDELVIKTGGKWLLDVGCGTGHFGSYMAEFGWNVVGIEPSRDAAALANSFKFEVYDSVDECSAHETRQFDGITFLNVLEHISNPVGLLRRIMPLLAPQGVIVARVPNDFTSIQESARAKLKVNPWWIAVPDHINYFNFESLEALFKDLGLEILVTQSDFPMEMFLLFGDNYVEDPEIGKACHKRRREFELSLPTNLRRDLYKCFARNGIGRNCLIFARLKSPYGDKL